MARLIGETLLAYKKAVNNLPNPIPLEDAEHTIATIKNLAFIAKKIDTADTREAIGIASLGNIVVHNEKQLKFVILYDRNSQTGLYIDREGLFVMSAKQNGIIIPRVKHRSFLFEEFAFFLPFWGAKDFTEKIINAAIENVSKNIISQLNIHYDKITKGTNNGKTKPKIS